MTLYRTVHTSFWYDTKVCDDMTANERYMTLYLLTNPHTNIIGCYEVSKASISRETGLCDDDVTSILERLEQLGVARYCEKTREVLLLHWHRYNWSTSPKTYAAIRKALPMVKSHEFAKYVADRYNESEKVTDPYVIAEPKKDKHPKHRHGEYGNVLLTDDELEKLKVEFTDWDTRIERLSSYIESKGAKYKSHYATIRAWARKESPGRQGRGWNDDALSDWM